MFCVCITKGTTNFVVQTLFVKDKHISSINLASSSGPAPGCQELNLGRKPPWHGAPWQQAGFCRASDADFGPARAMFGKPFEHLIGHVHWEPPVGQRR